MAEDLLVVTHAHFFLVQQLNTHTHTHAHAKWTKEFAIQTKKQNEWTKNKTMNASDE